MLSKALSNKAQIYSPEGIVNRFDDQDTHTYYNRGR